MECRRTERGTCLCTLRLGAGLRASPGVVLVFYQRPVYGLMDCSHSNLAPQLASPVRSCLSLAGHSTCSLHVRISYSKLEEHWGRAYCLGAVVLTCKVANILDYKSYSSYVYCCAHLESHRVRMCIFEPQCLRYLLGEGPCITLASYFDT